MVILGVVGGILLMTLILLLSMPIVIRFQTPSTCLWVRWFFVTFQWYEKEETYYSELTLFSKRLTFPKKKETPPHTTSSKKKSTKDKKKSSSPKKRFFSALAYANQNSLIEDSFSLILNFCGRLYRSFRIKRFICWIGLSDYYWQGILTGFLQGVPTTEHLQINGNFEEKNLLDMEVRISIWKVLFAITALLFRLPYVRVFRLYRILK